MSNTPLSTRSASSGLRPRLFKPRWPSILRADTPALERALSTHGPWDPRARPKLVAAARACSTKTHAKDKVLVFTQFADTARYLAREMRKAASRIGGRHRRQADPYALACRFSPKSNNKTRDQGRRGARADLHRRAVRRTEPARLQRRRQLRPALGHHPPDPARRPRRPHRPAVRKKSTATPSCPPTASSA